MNTKEKVFKKIQQLCADKLDCYDHQEANSIRENDVILESKMDSIDLIVLSMNLEREYNISLPDNDLFCCKTFGELATLIANQLTKNKHHLP